MYHHEIKGGVNTAEMVIQVVETSLIMKDRIGSRHYKDIEIHGIRGPDSVESTTQEMGVT